MGLNLWNFEFYLKMNKNTSFTVPSLRPDPHNFDADPEPDPSFQIKAQNF